MSHHWCCNLEEGSKTTVTEIFCMSVCLWEVDPLKLTIYPGPAIRRTMRQWGRTTLRKGRLWGHILWGNCEPKNVCPQSRIQMRLWGQNWQNLQNKLQKYWIYDANTWGWVFLLDICCKHLEKICNFVVFCLGNVHILLDTCCQNLGIYVIWRVSGRPSGAGLGNVHFLTFFLQFFQKFLTILPIFVIKVASGCDFEDKIYVLVMLNFLRYFVLKVAFLKVVCPQSPIGIPTDH